MLCDSQTTMKSSSRASASDACAHSSIHAIMPSRPGAPSSDYRIRFLAARTSVLTGGSLLRPSRSGRVRPAAMGLPSLMLASISEVACLTSRASSLLNSRSCTSCTSRYVSTSEHFRHSICVGQRDFLFRCRARSAGPCARGNAHSAWRVMHIHVEIACA